MNPLSNVYYIYKNKWQPLPIIIVLAAQIGIIIFIISIGIALLDGIKFCSHLEFENIVYVDKNSKSPEKEQQLIYEEIVGYKNTQGVLEGHVAYINTRLIFFNIESSVLLGLKPPAMEETMNRLGVRLIEGRLPKNQGEIILTQQGMKAAKVQIGDRLEEGDLLELERNYTVVGVVEAPMSIAISGQDLPSNAWLVFTDKEKIEETATYFKKYVTGLKCISGYLDYKLFYKAIRRVLMFLGTLLIGAFSLGIWVTIHHLVYTHLTTRDNELDLLKALGYSIRSIRKRVLGFFSISLILGTLLGLGIGELLIVLFAYLYCYEQGMIYALWHINFLVIPLIITLILYLIIVISVNNYIKGIQTIKTN